MNEMLDRSRHASLETRIVILEAALAWVRHEARASAHDAAGRAKAMERISAIASQVLEDDDRAFLRMRRHLALRAPASGTAPRAD